MPRFGISAALGLGLLCALPGCSHMIESRAIESFTFAFQEQDMALLRDSASEDFEHKALRRAESLDDLKILRLPEEPPAIVEVVDVDESHKDVTVVLGEDKKKGRQLLYKLVMDSETGQWVVDDVHMKQKKKGLEVTRSVTDQMDLLLTVRDSLESWEDGDRDELLASATPRLKKVLSELPPSYLQRIVSEVMGEQEKRSRGHRPEAQMDKNIAIVKLPRHDGSLIVSYKLMDDEWMIDDIAKNTGDSETSIPSLSKLASVVQAAVGFLAAYEEEDRKTLEKRSSRKLYRGALLPGDLKSVKLPNSVTAPEKLDVTTYSDRATFICESDNHLVKLDLARSDIDSDSTVPVTYVVSDVTLYEHGSNQRKRLSAIFTSQDRMKLFADALAQGDLNLLRSLSTPEFNERVWNRIERDQLAQLPGLKALTTVPRNNELRFEGAFTEIAGQLGDRKVRYRLRDWNGELGVDDVILSEPGFPASVRDRFEIMIPVIQFAGGVETQAIAELQRNSTDDFNRLIWKQVKAVPNIGFPIDQHLETQVTSITRRGAERAEIRLGDERWGARISMMMQRGYWVVDEVMLIAGVEPQRRAEMKHTMRIQLANGFAQTNPVPVQRPTGIQQVSHEEVPRRDAATVQQAAPDQQAAPVEQAAPVRQLTQRPRQMPKRFPLHADKPSMDNAMKLQSESSLPPIEIDKTPVTSPSGKPLLDDPDAMMPPIDIPLN